MNFGLNLSVFRYFEKFAEKKSTYNAWDFDVARCYTFIWGWISLPLKYDIHLDVVHGSIIAKHFTLLFMQQLLHNIYLTIFTQDKFIVNSYDYHFFVSFSSNLNFRKCDKNAKESYIMMFFFFLNGICEKQNL